MPHIAFRMTNFWSAFRLVTAALACMLNANHAAAITCRVLAAPEAADSEYGIPPASWSWAQKMRRTGDGMGYDIQGMIGNMEPFMDWPRPQWLQALAVAPVNGQLDLPLGIQVGSGENNIKRNLFLPVGVPGDQISRVTYAGEVYLRTKSQRSSDEKELLTTFERPECSANCERVVIQFNLNTLQNNKNVLENNPGLPATQTLVTALVKELPIRTLANTIDPQDLMLSRLNPYPQVDYQKFTEDGREQIFETLIPSRDHIFNGNIQRVKYTPNNPYNTEMKTVLRSGQKALGRDGDAIDFKSNYNLVNSLSEIDVDFGSGKGMRTLKRAMPIALGPQKTNGEGPVYIRHQIVLFQGWVESRFAKVYVLVSVLDEELVANPNRSRNFRVQLLKPQR